ncbi:MAG: Gfo/Idh/MocA family oxidoreductase [Candidatus Latescibacteria bacterium]|nr:Gfo/Idh/MocA family oxidoreductase [Candidatus Latescibacterota bacterium]
MDKIRIGLVGCGGMGTRHLYGLKELTKTPLCNVELCTLCDIRRDNAELAAVEAEKLLGIRPTIFTDMEEMVRKTPDLDAVDIVTDPSTHHDVACHALDLGLHVMVEKPLAITVRACLKMIESAERNGRKLSVAENFRRDPSTRLVHHLLETDAIGKPYMAMFHYVEPGNTIFITPWRHLKQRGGLLLDMGVHFTDLIRYQLGEIDEVYGDVRLVEPVRKKPERSSSPYEFYRTRFKEMDAEIQAMAEDTSLAMFRMKSGIPLNWMVGLGGHGSYSRETIFGDRGIIEGFGTRGGSTRLKLDRGEVSHKEAVEMAEGFSVEPLADYLFPTRIASGDPAVDWKLIALEYYELADAILTGRKIEVDGIEGMKDVAAIYAICESSIAGRAVKMSEVETCQVYAYQAEIDEALGEVSDHAIAVFR